MKNPFLILPYLSLRDNLISEFNECFKCNLDSEIRFFEQISDYLKIDRLALKLKPYWTAMLFRNLASMDVEEAIRGNPIDGVVLLMGCDKTTPS